MGSALAHGWEPPSRGGAPPQRLTMGPVQKSQTSSHIVHDVMYDRIVACEKRYFPAKS
jgi:hypothetical protein